MALNNAKGQRVIKELIELQFTIEEVGVEKLTLFQEGYNAGLRAAAAKLKFVIDEGAVKRGNAVE